MVFKKGSIPWNKGKIGVVSIPWNKGLTKFDDERLMNISNVSKGNTKCKGRVFRHSEKTKEILRIKSTGRKSTEKQREALKLGQLFFKGKTKENCEAIVHRASKLSQMYSGKKNPEHSKKLKKFYNDFPEKHPNRKMTKISNPQRKIYNLVKVDFQDAELEYPIKTENGIRYADVGIPSLKIDVEYDGTYWHLNKNDGKRDEELEKVGWTTIRISEVNMEDMDKVIAAIRTAIIKATADIEIHAKRLCPVDNSAMFIHQRNQ